MLSLLTNTVDASASSSSTTVLYPTVDNLMVFISLVLLSFILPLAILFAKVFFKDRRMYAAKVLHAEFPELAKTYTFRFALAKYVDTNDASASIRELLANYRTSQTIRNCRSELLAYVLPAIAYGVICAAGFYTAMMVRVVDIDNPDHFDNYLIYGMRVAGDAASPAGKLSPGGASTDAPASTGARPGATSVDEAPPIAGAAPTSQQTGLSSGIGATSTAVADRKNGLREYGRGTIAVSVAGFIGAYLWTLIFLARRVTNFDLSPFSFLRATIQICLACFVCIFLRHLYDSISYAVWQSASPMQNTVPATSSWLLTVAFLIGFYPALGLNYLQERFAFLRFKTRNAHAEALSRELSLDMVDGIDSYIKFRLGEYEIEDIQNLALANPIQLFIETPYTLRKIVDWVAQAQLILEVDNSKILDLRNLNVRTSLDLLRFGETEEGQNILGGILHPTQSDGAGANNLIKQGLRPFSGKAHVRALQDIVEIITEKQPLLANDDTLGASLAAAE